MTPIEKLRSWVDGASRKPGSRGAIGRTRRAKKPTHRQIAAVGAAAAALLLATLAASYRDAVESTGQTSRRALKRAAVRAVESLPSPDLLRPLAADEAVKANASRAYAARPDNPASPFKLRAADASNRLQAEECLAQAIYYEAASESIEGQRAVAQVVLNRMRHPAYPSTVCGVVYQGSARTTGCQFSFTCDGSLLRVPSASLFARARRLAKEALAGYVFGPVGHATHYHADYVLPYWADSLDKMAQIGRHIYYRFRGTIGTGRAFSQAYRGRETVPVTPAKSDILAEALDAASTVENPLEPDRDAALPADNPVSQPQVALVADEGIGQLLVDGGAGTTPRRRKAETAECQPETAKQVTAVGANDLRSTRSGERC